MILQKVYSFFLFFLSMITILSLIKLSSSFYDPTAYVILKSQYFYNICHLQITKYGQQQRLYTMDMSFSSLIYLGV